MKHKALLLGISLSSALVFSAGGVAMAASENSPQNSQNVDSASSGILLPGGENTSQHEFWKIDEYENWMEQERAKNQELADSGDKSFWVEDASDTYVCREWTQEDVDTLYAEWEAQLDLMKQGYHVTKPITLPNGGSLVGAINPETWNVKSESAPGSTIITLPDGSTVDLGHFDTAAAATKAVEEFLTQQVTAGTITQKEANALLAHGATEK